MINTGFPNPNRRVNYDWINESFTLFQRDIYIWILALLLYIVSSLSISFGLEALFGLLGRTPLPAPGAGGATFTDELSHIFTPTYWAFLATSWPLGLLLGAFLIGGLFKMANKSVRGQRLELKDIVSGGPTMLQFLLFIFVFTTAINLGLFCVVGGLVVCGLFYPAYALIADGETFVPAVSRSFEAMKTDWLNATALTLLTGLLCLVSYFCCVGIFVTFPMAIIIGSLAYRDMIGMPGGPTITDNSPTIPGSWPPPPMQ